MQPTTQTLADRASPTATHGVPAAAEGPLTYDATVLYHWYFNHISLTLEPGPINCCNHNAMGSVRFLRTQALCLTSSRVLAPVSAIPPASPSAPSTASWGPSPSTHCAASPSRACSCSSIPMSAPTAAPVSRSARRMPSTPRSNCLPDPRTPRATGRFLRRLRRRVDPGQRFRRERLATRRGRPKARLDGVGVVAQR